MKKFVASALLGVSAVSLAGCAFEPASEADLADQADEAVTRSVATASELASAVKGAKSGDVITLAAGVYKMSAKLVLSASNVTISAPSGATLDYGQSKSTDNAYGIDITGSNNRLSNLTIMRAGDNGVHIVGSGNTVERCKFHDNYDTGLQISGKETEGAPAPSNNKIINCDSYANHDTHTSSGGDADGFAAKINVGPGNSFYGCVAHDNSDDGWDLFPKVASGSNPVTIENSISYHNGYIGSTRAGNGNGFKLGSNLTSGGAHTVKNSVAFNNPSKGFDENHNMSRVNLSNDTGVNNASANFAFNDSQASGVGANITNSVANGKWQQSGGTESGNVKNASTSSFTNLDPSKISRASDGTLHLNGFAAYKPSSAGAHF